MGEAFLDYKKGGSGGLDINGVIEDYYVYAGENVNAGDFVEFINGVASSKTETSNDTPIFETVGYGYELSACKINENQVFIAHRNGTAGSGTLWGVICTISGTKITYGTDTQLVTASYSGYKISAVTLEENKVFIKHAWGSNYYLYGIVCTIDGTTIMAGTDVAICSKEYASTASIDVLSSSSVFIAHEYPYSSSGSAIYGIVCRITGTTIGVGVDTAIQSGSSTVGYAPSSGLATVALSSTSTFVTFVDSSYDLYGVVCTISETTISKGTRQTIDTGYNHLPKMLLLDNGDVFIALVAGNSNEASASLKALVCTISGTTFTAGTITTLGGTYSNNISCGLLLSGKVFITHSRSSSYYLYGRVCAVSGTTITTGTDTQLSSVVDSGAGHSTIVLSNGTIFIPHRYDNTNYYLYGQVWGVDETNNIPTNQVEVNEYETQVKKATTLPCNGVASTSGEGGDETGHKDVVSVFLPLSFYNQFNLITNGDFSNGLEGWTLTSSAFSQLTSETGGYEGNCAKVTITNPPTYASSCNLENVEFNLYANHVYYISFLYKGFKNNVANMDAGISLFNSSLKAFVTSTSNFTEGGDLITWQKRSAYGTNSEDGKGYVTLYTSIQNHDITITEGMAICYDNIRCYDLTAIFGVGNEPTQEWCDANL